MVQLYAVQYQPGRFHSGGSKTGTKVALYDDAGANRIMGRYKKFYPDVKKVPVAFWFTQEAAESNADDADFLLCLQGAGVDNWVGYEFAQEEYAKLNGDSDE